MKYFLSFLLLLLAYQVLAQQPQVLMERSYKVSSEEKELRKTAFDKQGNILFAGTRLVSAQTYRSNLLMVGPNTDTIWTRNGANLLGHGLQTLAATLEGGFIYTEATKHPTINAAKGLQMQKLSSSGNIIWSKNNYFNNTANLATSVLVMPDKGFLFTGIIEGKSGKLLRTDSLGNTKWLRDHSRSNWSDIDLLQFTKNGKIAAYGITDIPIGPGHPLLMLLNQYGDSLKGRQLVVTGFNRFETMYTFYNSLLPLSDGGFLITGFTDTTSSQAPGTQAMGMITKVDSSFNLQWKYVHRSQTNPVETFIFSKSKELADGSILVLGFKFVPAPGSNSFQLYRFSPNGQLMNVYPFTSNICTQVSGITLDALPDSTFLIGGKCGNPNPVTYGYYIAKVKIPGLPLPLPPVTITSTKEELAINGAGLGQSYPNPTAASANIPYTLPQHYTKASILIREIATGREIKRYELKRNSNSLNVDLSQLSNGLYLYSLVVDEQPVATKKLAVMK